MSFFQGAKNITVVGGTQVAAAAGSTVSIYNGGQSTTSSGMSSAFRYLSAAAAHTALHDSSARYDAPRCHRNTRAKQLDKLELWILGQSEEYAGKRLIWLCGGAGAGKSAIMQSIVERCSPHGVVLGSFFFSRSDPSRNTAEWLIPTLAYQVVRAFPVAMAVLDPVIDRDPLIFKASFSTQAYELLVRPLLYLIETGAIGDSSAFRGVFFVDGLDECSNPQKQALLIDTVASILKEHSLPVLFLIASRPEVAISNQFHCQYYLKPIFATLLLDDDEDAQSDIRHYINDSFLDIIDLHPLRDHIKLPWPTPISVENLVRKSSGHFIYAATAMKFIASHNEHPVRALEVIEGLKPSRTGSPFAELDALYLHILTSAKYASEVFKILRHCFFTHFRHNLRAVCCVHDISPVDVELFLSDVQALVSVTYHNPTGAMVVRSKHASLEDFLVVEARSQQVYIAPKVFKASLLTPLFKLLTPNMADLALGSQLWGMHPTFRTEVPTNGGTDLILTLCDAIRYSQEEDLLVSLIRAHSPKLIWNLASGQFNGQHGSHTTIIQCYSVSNYMSAIRDSMSNKNNALYLHHFPAYMQILLDNLEHNRDDSLYREYLRPDMKFWDSHPTTSILENTSRYTEIIFYDDSITTSNQSPNIIIPALIFSSMPSALRLAHHVLFKFASRFRINQSHACYLSHLIDSSDSDVNPHLVISSHRTLEALRCQPQSQVSWSAGLATAMKLVLQELLHQSWRPPFYFTNRHDQWLKRRKPSKHASVGSPALSTRFYDYKRGWPITEYDYNPAYDYWLPPEWGPLSTNLCKKKSRVMCEQGYDCILLLQTVIFFLRKAACTNEVAKLARRSLPKVARWFPKLMRRARREMDAYVVRWEESLAGLLEKTRLFSMNNMD